MPKLIVALDFDNEHETLNLVDKLDPKTCALKVGSELFTLFGAHLLKQLIKRQFKVFLDLKFHDIPNTVAKACNAGAELGVWMINVHAAGGMKMMQAARKAIDAYGKGKPILIAVTILTSFNQNDLSSIGINIPILEQVIKLAILAKESGLDGVVSSAQEVKLIKNACGSQFITVTPGIRSATDSIDDQARIMTPKQAIAEGSDYLVIGRSITRSANPEIALTEILKDIGSVEYS